MSEKQLHVTIVGGGMTGLTAAYYLQKWTREQGLPVRFTLLEASDRTGGKVQTWKHEGFTIELGADSFLERKTSATELIKDVGLGDRLVNNNAGQAYILHKNGLYTIPEGAVMGVPTKLMPFAMTPLISPLGKLRAAVDLILPGAQTGEDESVGNFFRRRLGDEVIENVIEPLISGVYGGDIDKLSLLSTFPQYAQMEQKHRSLIMAMRNSRPKQSKQSEGQPKSKGMFVSLTSGLQSLADRLEELLPADSVRKSTAVKRLEKRQDGYSVELAHGEVFDTDAVILAIPHHLAREVVKEHVDIPPISGAKPTIMATVALAYPEQGVRIDKEGTGFVVPRKEKFTITACTWTQRKWPHTTPKGKALVRCYVGKPGAEEIVDRSDEEIVDVVVRDLQKVMQIDDHPEFYKVTRWNRGLPYLVGHKQWLKGATAKMKEHLPGVWLTGGSYGGVGVPDCIDQAKQTVQELLEYWTQKPGS
ncbi:protoporphyrinogen oxidase [Brevibacillus borstelensis]|jgi:protoporphyrinogen/coproporphyrinogen III oxidase|uniref:protoporphyrinogen oxidase n=1 Tax=Brevibacillus borstelensis TaxID=45462 RepID=UPI000F075312|nr:protoporphyrinogen oxidase [Brevibacillus borstelensis]MBE5394607.1 protoporphyrinogen oxidase [Brevibacillus borstelensis]MED1884717.1 protoporphyrinogen oxidase [Brevibacillus borstelensis]RNB63666.1 protoporphyrinogen oxidase [Brevibacillus borstelensis]GED50850.1 protoporphyrinogen oxidase [Brevibacillus borstelensis]